MGQTVDESRFRRNNYKSNCRKHQRGETCMQQHLYEHFRSSNHDCLKRDVSVTFIDKTDPSYPLKREDHGITLRSSVLMLKKVYEGPCFWYLCCVALGAAMLGVKKFFKLLAAHCHYFHYYCYIYIYIYIYI